MTNEHDGEPPGSKMEYVVALCFVAALAGAVGFAVSYWMNWGIQAEGLAAAVCLAGFAVGLGVWANTTLERTEVSEQREPLGSTRAERLDAVAGFERGERRVERRRLLAVLAGSSIVAAAVAALFPLRSLGPRPDDTLSHTDWRRGIRLTDDEGEPVDPDDLDVATALTVYPEGTTEAAGRAAAQTVLIKLDDAASKAASANGDQTVADCIAYSRVCTHAGCPVGVYQPNTQQLMCPCHQSLFDVLEGAKPVFGPASRPLPRLPLMRDPQGYLVARGDFDQPIGPGYWNR